MIFGTVTYAWITMASVNTIDGMSLTAQSGNELLISIDGINYSRDVPAIALDELLRNIKLVDVTTSDGINFERGGLNEGEQVLANRDYLSFELWLQTDEPEHLIYLVENVSQFLQFDTTMNGTYVVSQGVTWKSDVTFINGPSLLQTVVKGEQHTYYGSEAIRIGIREIKDINNPLDTRSSDQLSSFIYDPSENESRGYGASYGAYSYFISSSDVPITLPSLVPDTQYRLSSFYPDDPYFAQDEDSLIAILQPSESVSSRGKVLYRGKIVVSIWVEGWDADAFNSILNDRIKIQLKFKAARSSD